jgi:hypothetical protein
MIIRRNGAKSRSPQLKFSWGLNNNNKKKKRCKNNKSPNFVWGLNNNNNINNKKWCKNNNSQTSLGNLIIRTWANTICLINFVWEP